MAASVQGIWYLLQEHRTHQRQHGAQSLTDPDLVSLVEESQGSWQVAAAGCILQLTCTALLRLAQQAAGHACVSILCCTTRSELLTDGYAAGKLGHQGANADQQHEERDANRVDCCLLKNALVRGHLCSSARCRRHRDLSIESMLAGCAAARKPQWWCASIASPQADARRRQTRPGTSHHL